MLTTFIDKKSQVTSIAKFLDIVVPDYYFTDDAIKNDMLTYHNIHHMMSVCCIAFSDLMQGPQGFVLTKSEQQILFLSCMIHDFHHKQESGNDYININNAVSYVETKLYEWFPTYSKSYSEVLKWYVKDTIKCTEFPFKHEPMTRVQQIIRDCDLMMFTQIDGGIYLKGLCNEMKMYDLTGEQAVQQHFEFMKSIRWYTTMGQQLYDLYYSSSYEPQIADHWLSVCNQFNQVI